MATTSPLLNWTTEQVNASLAAIARAGRHPAAYIDTAPEPDDEWHPGAPGALEWPETASA